MDSSKPITNVDDFDELAASAAVKFFCRHLVALDGRWQPLDKNGKPRGIARSKQHCPNIRGELGTPTRD